MRKIWLLLLLAALLAGCADTTVFIPEDDRQAGDGVVLYIPMNPEAETEEETVPETTATTEPVEIEPEQKNTASVSKKTASSSNKGTSASDKTETTNKETITGNAEQTEPAESVTEAPTEADRITVTEPSATELATELATEPAATEPPATEPPLYDIYDYAVGDLEYAVLERINECRLNAGLDELWMDEYLCAIASCRAYEASLVWSHTRPDGRSYGTVLADYGYGSSATGELLGYSTGDGAAVADKWMSSESHCALLMGDSSVAGIGIYCAGGVIYVACLLVG